MKKENSNLKFNKAASFLNYTLYDHTSLILQHNLLHYIYFKLKKCKLMTKTKICGRKLYENE